MSFVDFSRVERRRRRSRIKWTRNFIKILETWSDENFRSASLCVRCDVILRDFRCFFRRYRELFFLHVLIHTRFFISIVIINNIIILGDTMSQYRWVLKADEYRLQYDIDLIFQLQQHETAKACILATLSQNSTTYTHCSARFTHPISNWFIFFNMPLLRYHILTYSWKIWC